MATANTLPAEAGQAELTDEERAEQALVPVSAAPEPVSTWVLSPAAALLPIEIDVAVPMRSFRVRNLLALEPGQLLESQWSHGSDLPLAAGKVNLAWAEFEVVESTLAVRVTRLA
ncbi:MAG TPA: FliM/FliN family flagellar motor C-terminal domain-containing protein [Terracidiphilus sp.]